MICKTLDLYDTCGVEKPKDARADLSVYVWENSQEIDMERRRPAILVCPGGAYGYCSDREAEAIAFRFFSAGFNAFVLRYSLAPVHFPAQLIEGVLAVDLIRKNAREWNTDPEGIVACGFSAGGHFVGMLATITDCEEVTSAIGKRDGKPNACLLCYPVITAGPFSHRDSIYNLSGRRENVEEFSLEKRVDRETVPSFIWATANDAAVPAQNSLLFASALAEAGVDYELHIFQNGPHGLATADEETAPVGCPDYINPRVAQWIPLALSWLKSRGICLRSEK